MSDAYHAVVWLDHSEAKVIRFDGAEESEVDIHAHTSLQRLLDIQRSAKHGSTCGIPVGSGREP